MSQFVETPCKTFTAGGAIGKHLRVKLSTGKLAAAGVADDWIGTMVNASFADLDVSSVRLRSAQGTCKFVAAGAITAGSRVYAAASGKVDDAITTELIGIALEAANDADEVIEVLQLPGGQAYRIARGVLTTATASDTVVTGLNTVVAVMATLASDPVDDPMLVTATIGDQAGTPAAGSVLIKTWKNTGGTDPTPAAASTFSKLVNWVAIGT